MARISLALPSGVVVLLTLMAALPWGVTTPSRFALSLLPVLAIIHFTLIRPTLVPTPVAFACGLMLDVLTYGPLGYWAGINVCAQMLSALAVPSGDGRAVVRAILVGVLLAVMSLLSWAIASLTFNEVAAWRPIAVAVAIAGLCYPLLVRLSRPLERALAANEPLHLEPGG